MAIDDRWGEAAIIYESVLGLLSASDDLSWEHLYSGMTTIAAIELLSAWALRLPLESGDAADSILRLLSEFAEANAATFEAGNNVGGRSLTAIKDVGAKRVEWRRNSSTPVARAVVAHFSVSGWWTGMQTAAEIASVYASAFSNEDIATVTDAALLLLENINSTFWMVIRPIEDFITCPRASAFIRGDEKRERKALELILRLGTEQRSEQANMMHYLRMFDGRLLENAELKSRLQNTILEIEDKARLTTNSSSVANIQALLNASALCGLSGVKVALESLEKILKSADSPRQHIVLFPAYLPLLQLAVEYERIAASIGLSSEEFKTMLLPLGALLENLWLTVATKPALFVPFSIPASEVPNPVTVHNWTFVSLRFAEMLGEEESVGRAIDRAARAQPSITSSVERAKAIRALSSGENTFDEEKVKHDSRDVFYLNLGSRLSQVDAATEKGKEQCLLLLDMCLRHGPHDLDMAVLMQARQSGLSLTMIDDSVVSKYVERLGSYQERRLNFMPLLQRLEYKETL